jgi:hypothetical protein
MVDAPSTLVLQSFRSDRVPEWIDRCSASVRAWGRRNSFAYRLLGDEIFDQLPGWFVAKMHGDLVPLSDLGRLQAMQRIFQAESWERIIWVDIDVLVFDAPRFVIADLEPIYLVEELWVAPHADAPGYVVRWKVNNSVMACRRDAPIDALRLEALDAIRRIDEPDRIDVSTRLLTARQRETPLPLLRCVGCLGPPVIRDLLAGGGQALSLLTAARATPLGAANLCRSFSDDDPSTGHVSARELSAAVDVLLARGSVLLEPTIGGHARPPDAAGAAHSERPG